jgi:hypothetical protein
LTSSGLRSAPAPVSFTWIIGWSMAWWAARTVVLPLTLSKLQPSTHRPASVSGR